MRTLEEVREFFKNDVYASGTTGIEIEDARPGYAKVTLKIDERHINAVDRVMGAVYYTMADFAFAVATNYEYDKKKKLTACPPAFGTNRAARCGHGRRQLHGAALQELHNRFPQRGRA